MLRGSRRGTHFPVMTATWAMFATELSAWSGRDPRDLHTTIGLLRYLVEAAQRELPSELTRERWAQLVAGTTGALARLVELAATGSTETAQDAQRSAAELSPLVTKMAGELTLKLSKGWKKP